MRGEFLLRNMPARPNWRRLHRHRARLCCIPSNSAS